MCINLDDIIFERLNPQHNVAGFCCGEEDVDYNLTSGRNLEYQRKGLGTTTVALYKNQIVGFYELRCAEVEIDKKAVEQLRLSHICFLPVVEISLFGVRKSYQKCGIGRIMLENLLDESIFAKDWLGFSHLFVKAKSNAVNWYVKQGFEKTDLETYDELIHMRLPVPDSYEVEQGLF
ncbi:GNAT family N-acetyltransferase [Priestia flexa]|uniref:GNAT family N-acetyltransferase n=1 Tax=Priestia flexa TaxID=86664 RepID=UPI0024920AFE|nr:GNAT family N-acetyltransferase [Priestia flexa]